MNRVARPLLVTVAVLVAFWLIWSKLRIVVFVQASLGQMLLLFGVLAVALFLALDHFFNRSR